MLAWRKIIAIDRSLLATPAIPKSSQPEVGGSISAAPRLKPVTATLRSICEPCISEHSHGTVQFCRGLLGVSGNFVNGARVLRGSTKVPSLPCVVVMKV